MVCLGLENQPQKPFYTVGPRAPAQGFRPMHKLLYLMNHLVDLNLL